jgi:NAD(P) transhydrogenase
VATRRKRGVCAIVQEATGAKLRGAGADYLPGMSAPVPGGRRDSRRGAERVLQAGTIVIATGSRPFRPASVPFDDPDVFDSDAVVARRRGRLLRDLSIVGGGAIGVEFATDFAAGGVEVTSMHRGECLLPAMDGEIVGLLAQDLDRLGVRVVLGEGPRRIGRVDDRLVAEHDDGESPVAECVLYAVGRSVNTEGPGLAGAGIATGRRGVIAVDDHFRTSVPGISAAGDVEGPTLASIAMEQGQAAVCHAFGMTLKDYVDPMTMSAVSGMPEVAGDGPTEGACREQRIAYAVGRRRFDDVARGVISGRTDGLLKLVFRPADRKLLGVHAIAEVAAELVGMGQAVLHDGGSIDACIALTLNTPTYTMAYKIAAADRLRRLARSRGPAFVASFRSD